MSNNPIVSPSSAFGGARRARFTGEVSAVGSRIQFVMSVLLKI
jgi:hypothetical protein